MINLKFEYIHVKENICFYVQNENMLGLFGNI